MPGDWEHIEVEARHFEPWTEVAEEWVAGVQVHTGWHIEQGKVAEEPGEPGEQGTVLSTGKVGHTKVAYCAEHMLAVAPAHMLVVQLDRWVAGMQPVLNLRKRLQRPWLARPQYTIGRMQLVPVPPSGLRTLAEQAEQVAHIAWCSWEVRRLRTCLVRSPWAAASSSLPAVASHQGLCGHKVSSCSSALQEVN